MLLTVCTEAGLVLAPTPPIEVKVFRNYVHDDSQLQAVPVYYKRI